jgi:hypothetical protein
MPHSRGRGVIEISGVRADRRPRHRRSRRSRTRHDHPSRRSAGRSRRPNASASSPDEHNPRARNSVERSSVSCSSPAVTVIDVAKNVARRPWVSASVRGGTNQPQPSPHGTRRTTDPLLTSDFVLGRDDTVSNEVTRLDRPKPPDQQRVCFASRGSWVRVPSSPPKSCWSWPCGFSVTFANSVSVPTACPPVTVSRASSRALEGTGALRRSARGNERCLRPGRRSRVGTGAQPQPMRDRRAMSAIRLVPACGRQRGRSMPR